MLGSAGTSSFNRLKILKCNIGCMSSWLLSDLQEAFRLPLGILLFDPMAMFILRYTHGTDEEGGAEDVGTLFSFVLGRG